MKQKRLALVCIAANWAAWLGGLNDEVALIEQTVTVPASDPTISFWYFISSEDSCGRDGAALVIDSTPVDVINLCASENTTEWTAKSISLADYAGQTVNLQIRVETDASNISSFLVDDVTLMGSGEGQSPVYVLQIENTNPYAKQGAQAYISMSKRLITATPTPETPTPDTPMPDTPTPDTSTSDTPTPDTPTPDAPTPVPATLTSVPDTPTPQTPVASQQSKSVYLPFTTKGENNVQSSSQLVADRKLLILPKDDKEPNDEQGTSMRRLFDAVLSKDRKEK